MKIFVMGGARLPTEEGHLLIWPVIEKAIPEYLLNYVHSSVAHLIIYLFLCVKDSHPWAASLEKLMLLKQYYLDMQPQSGCFYLKVTCIPSITIPTV